jgi:hypothetical protein
MSRHLGFYIPCLLAYLTLSAPVHAEDGSDAGLPPRSNVVNEDAGSEPETEDAGESKPKCIEEYCDDAGVCSPAESDEENCEADDQIIDPRVNPPSERDMTGCGCSWYRTSASTSLALFGIGLVLAARRKKRRG